MATDNRHRPGPMFRCPTCRSQRVRLVGGGALYRDIGKRRAYRVECQVETCNRNWFSFHKQARRLANDAIARGAR